jgi:regulator of sigma E protease
MFTQIFTGHMPAGLTGPLGVVGVTAQAASQGILDLINLTALISINLALINLVPFPPLDGSRVLFLIIEIFVGRKKLPAIEEKVQTVGMYLLLILVVFLTFREVPKVFTSGSLEGFVQSLIQ